MVNPVSLFRLIKATVPLSSGKTIRVNLNLRLVHTVTNGEDRSIVIGTADRPCLQFLEHISLEGSDNVFRIFHLFARAIKGLSIDRSSKHLS